MRRGARLLAALLVVALPRSTAAQSAADFIALGVRAYQNLDYEQAATMLRRSLLRAGEDSVVATARLEALMYLGATEVFRGRTDSAKAAFRQLVVLDPSYRPNALIFPPQVTDLFGAVREGTKGVTASLPPVAELRVPADRYVIALQATSPHEINVALSKGEGTPLRVLYDGPIADSLAVAWDGLTEAGGLATDGRYVLRVTSRGPASAVQRVLQATLEIRRVAVDTAPASPRPAGGPQAPAPPPPTSGPAVRSLAAGALAAAAVIALPQVVSGDGKASGARFAVAATIGVSGIVGFFRQRPRAIAGARDVRLPRSGRLVIRAGRPIVVERETQ